MFNLKLYARALEVVPDHYMLVNALSMRIRQLQGGVEPLVDPGDLTLFDIAMKEVVERKIEIKRHGETTQLAFDEEQ